MSCSVFVRWSPLTEQHELRTRDADGAPDPAEPAARGSGRHPVRLWLRGILEI